MDARTQDFLLDEDAAMPRHLDHVDIYLTLMAAGKPLWDALAHLGWVDSYGGMEFKRVFPMALDFIHEQANRLPQTAQMAQASEQDETIAAPLEDDVQEVGDEE